MRYHGVPVGTIIGKLGKMGGRLSVLGPETGCGYCGQSRSKPTLGEVMRDAGTACFSGRRDHTKRFPELAKAVEGLDAPSLVLDGEIAIFDRQLVSRFEWLRARPKHEVAPPPM